MGFSCEYLGGRMKPNPCMRHIGTECRFDPRLENPNGIGYGKLLSIGRLFGLKSQDSAVIVHIWRVEGTAFTPIR
jgi:hypothetical protein